MRNVIRKIAVFTLVLSVFGAPLLFAQSGPRYPRGAIFDEAAYNSLPRKAALASRAYEGLPKSYSLKLYAPQPGDQSDYGTCVAWASAYAARTISESVALSRRNQSESTRNAFSPVYVYRSIRPDDPECQQGAQIFRALDLMKDSGAVKMLDIEWTTDFPRIDLYAGIGVKAQIDRIAKGRKFLRNIGRVVDGVRQIIHIPVIAVTDNQGKTPGGLRVSGISRENKKT